MPIAIVLCLRNSPDSNIRPLHHQLPTTPTAEQLHSVVSNRLANVLNKARKGGYIQFKGELLLQGTHDDEPITLLKMPPQVHQITKTRMVKK